MRSSSRCRKPRTTHCAGGHHVAHQRRVAGEQEAVDARCRCRARRARASRRPAPADRRDGPAASAPIAAPAACAPPASAAAHKRLADAAAGLRAAMLRWRVTRRWPYSSQRSSSTGDTEMCESEPMPSVPPASRYAFSGNRPSPRFASVVGHRPATAPLSRQPARFVLGHVRRMHQAPARIDRGMIEQPFDRPRVAQRQAILHFADLLGDVDVDRAIARESASQHRAHRRFRHRAQRVQRDADAQGRRFERAQALEQAQIAVDVVAEAALAFGQRRGRRNRRSCTASAAGSARCRPRAPLRPAPATSPPDRRTACRRADDAGSGTRRPACSRP